MALCFQLGIVHGYPGLRLCLIAQVVLLLTCTHARPLVVALCYLRIYVGLKTLQECEDLPHRHGCGALVKRNIDCKSATLCLQLRAVKHEQLADEAVLVFAEPLGVRSFFGINFAPQETLLLPRNRRSTIFKTIGCPILLLLQLVALLNLAHVSPSTLSLRPLGEGVQPWLASAPLRRAGIPGAARSVVVSVPGG